MPVVVEVQSFRDGTIIGGGTYEMRVAIDYRSNGQEFLSYVEVDATKRNGTAPDGTYYEWPVRFYMSVSGQQSIVADKPGDPGWVPFGEVRRFPSSGTYSGYRLDGGAPAGRPYSFGCG